ncbi:hypothetical protein KMW28_10170 [Flammeovirga yaeyamensis]|uniref:Uncharacterized protein n=1 Tax=Flammeovirga yaeyamensis TaxID=367791 RepID=A0AAX1N1P4_9BACT|nr:hypothetical protein [Flammeovirga yaeyamensis]MBB3696482.1 lysyl-tRNA synthetase class II [Flammeovirga yaeyamensis]NMF35160.1 hypothetical protein [Flammeovirga yaeyamensis]QWG00020.1 hypothetical protein KMW28_10170 [Flammeovirga yaeyamensis]
MSVISFSGLTPIIMVIMLGLIMSFILAIVLRKRSKLVFIPIVIFISISIYFGFSIASIIHSFNEPLSEKHLKQLYENSTSPEELVKVGQIYTLTGRLTFRNYMGKMNFAELSETSNRRDSISILYDYINFETDIKDRSSKGNVIYLNSDDFKKVSDFEYDELIKNEQVVEMILKSEKLSDNEWLCLKVIDLEIKKGRTSISD